MKREVPYENPEMIILRLENRDDVIRTSQDLDYDDEKDWTGFY